MLLLTLLTYCNILNKFRLVFSVVSVIFCALIVAITSKLQIENLSKSNNELVKDVLLTLQSKRENFVISPLSVYITISLLQTVLLQINDYDVEKLKDEYKTLFPNINSTDVNFHVGNKFFVQHGVEFSDFVKDLAMQVFQVEMQAIDFKDKQNALSIVNAWASEHTKGKITTIVDDDLSDSTEILLVNAIYFQSDWDVQFNSLLTHKEPFYVTPTNVRHGEMMYTLNNMEYALDPGLNCEIVKLQYKNPNFNFILVIPSTSLDDVEMTLINHLDIILDFNAPRRRIQLTMPKFKISKKLDLEATLKKVFNPAN